MYVIDSIAFTGMNECQCFLTGIREHLLDGESCSDLIPLIQIIVSYEAVELGTKSDRLENGCYHYLE